MQECRRIYKERDGLQLVEAQSDALVGADALVICTEWQHFRAPDFDAMSSVLNHPVIFDGRNLYNPVRMRERGFTYYAIGRGESVKV